jgi:hypothetical protein
MRHRVQVGLCPYERKVALAPQLRALYYGLAGREWTPRGPVFVAPQLWF